MKTIRKLIVLAICVCLMAPVGLAAKTDSEILRELNPRVSTKKVELEIPNKSRKYIYLYSDKDLDLASGVVSFGFGSTEDIVEVGFGEYKDGRRQFCLQAVRPGKCTLTLDIYSVNADENGYSSEIWRTEIKVTVKKAKKAKNIVGFWDIVEADTFECPLSGNNQDVYLYNFYKGEFACHSNNKNVKVSKKGKLTIKKNFCGTAKITVRLKKGKFYDTGRKEKTIALVVKPARVKIGEPDSPKKETITTKIKLVPGATGYQVFIGKSLSDTGDQQWKSKDSTKFFVKKNQIQKGKIKIQNKKGGKKHIVSGKRYHLKVRAYKTVKGKKIYGEWSDEWAITVK